MKNMRISKALAGVGRILHDEGCSASSVYMFVGEIEVKGEVYHNAILNIAKFLDTEMFRLTERGTIRFLSGYNLVGGEI